MTDTSPQDDSPSKPQADAIDPASNPATPVESTPLSRRAQELFIAARELPEAEQEAFLARESRGVSTLIDEVFALLRGEDDSCPTVPTPPREKPGESE